MADDITPAQDPIDMELSPTLSLIKKAKPILTGRKVAALVTDGVEDSVLDALRKAVEKEGAVLAIVAPKIGGVTLSDRKKVPAQQKIDGGPSVLYDAVALLVSEKGAELLAKDAPTRDFIADAFAHCKFVGYTEPAAALLQAANVKPDGGFLALKTEKNAAQFLKLCGDLRFWEREAEVDADAE